MSAVQDGPHVVRIGRAYEKNIGVRLKISKESSFLLAAHERRLFFWYTLGQNPSTLMRYLAIRLLPLSPLAFLKG
jgi:hypothetical protein